MGSMVVAIRADQLLPQFLLELFDTLPSQYRHTWHVHEEILTKFQLFELRKFLCKFSTFILRCVYTGRSTPTTAFHVVI